MAKILYGAPVREQIKMGLKKRVQKLGRNPVLVIVQVGDRDDSNIYIRNKIKFGEEIGIKVSLKKFTEDIKEEELIAEIEKLNLDNEINGMIVQLPLPENLDREKIVQSIDIKKDVDGLTSPLASRSPLLEKEREEGILLVTPATARGVMALLDFYKIEVKGKKVVVIGRSKLAGGPIAESLKEKGGEVTVCHRSTENIASVCRGADILISATGQVGLVTKEFVREGQVVVDVGINRPHPSHEITPPNPLLLQEGGPKRPKIVGDVAFEEVELIVSAITPVPGGVGPLTVACLFENLLDLTEEVN